MKISQDAETISQTAHVIINSLTKQIETMREALERAEVDIEAASRYIEKAEGDTAFGLRQTLDIIRGALSPQVTGEGES